MLTVYRAGSAGLEATATQVDDSLSRAVWIDILIPTAGEESALERALGLDVPTREEMQKIEVSGRLYHEAGATYMTATVLARADSDYPEAVPITFILRADHLLTVRYAEPRSFPAFVAKAQRWPSEELTPVTLLLGLLDTISDRAADVLEQAGAELDALSRDVFERDRKRSKDRRDFRDVLLLIGRKGDLVSKSRESLVSLGRLLAFLGQTLQAREADAASRARVKTLSRDTQSLADHASFLSGKIGFLLDATLGMINIEQNAIIKIVSVVAVVFLPPTLVASIYGMNFEHMPELRWLLGYPLALGLMVLAAILPYAYFKRRGWL